MTADVESTVQSNPEKYSDGIMANVTDRFKQLTNLSKFRANMYDEKLTTRQAKKEAIVPVERRAYFQAARLGDTESQNKIRDYLRNAGLRGKVSVRVDRASGKYLVTDASGNTTQVQEQLTFVRHNGILILES